MKNHANGYIILKGLIELAARVKKNIGVFDMVVELAATHFSKPPADIKHLIAERNIIFSELNEHDTVEKSTRCLPHMAREIVRLENRYAKDMRNV